MPAAEAAVQRQLDEVVRLLTGAHYQLLGLEASLPPAEDPATEAEDPAGLAAELRGAIQCVLHDHLLPAIRALDAAARS